MIQGLCKDSGRVERLDTGGHLTLFTALKCCGVGGVSLLPFRKAPEDDTEIIYFEHPRPKKCNVSGSIGGKSITKCGVTMTP